MACSTTESSGACSIYNNNNNNKKTLSGIYRLSCPDCNIAYVGQTGRDFHTRYKEHLNPFQYNTQQSKALLQACGQRCCRLPSVTLVVSPSSPLLIAQPNILLTQSAEGGVPAHPLQPRHDYCHQPPSSYFE